MLEPTVPKALYHDESKGYNAMCRESDPVLSSWQAACTMLGVPRQGV